MKFWIITLWLFLFGTNAKAFDKLYCQSNLKDWIVTLTNSTKTAVLTPYNQNTSLLEAQSQKLIVKGVNAENVITIFPWNSLYIRIPNQTKKAYVVLSTEASNGFLIEIIDKESKISRIINCRFTF